MPRNKIEDLRNTLFETMERLLDVDEPMEIDRAKAVAFVGQTIINSAKIEVDFMRQTGTAGSGWFSPGTEPQQLGYATAETIPAQLTQASESTAEKVASLSLWNNEAYADLCLTCPLPSCDDTSPDCLIQIDRRKTA